MLAETVSLDGEVIALFLVVLSLAVVAWLAFGYIGYRLIRRGSTSAAFVGIGLVGIVDAWLVWIAVVEDAGLVAVPVLVHVIAAAWRLIETRDSGTPGS